MYLIVTIFIEINFNQRLKKLKLSHIGWPRSPAKHWPDLPRLPSESNAAVSRVSTGDNIGDTDEFPDSYNSDSEMKIIKR